MKKDDIINCFNLNKSQIYNIDLFLSKITTFNKHTNLVGRSTLEDPWDRHVLDCIQLSKYIPNKETKILDMGSGAGLPGVLLSILGYKNVLMIESTKKKGEFIKNIIKELSLSAKIQIQRIEKTNIPKQELIVSRALAPLNKLLTYTLLHSNKNTTSLFLKGRNVNKELEMAKKTFHFDFKIFTSLSLGEGQILQVKNINMKK